MISIKILVEKLGEEEENLGKTEFSGVFSDITLNEYEKTEF